MKNKIVGAVVGIALGSLVGGCIMLMYVAVPTIIENMSTNEISFVVAIIAIGGVVGFLD